MAASLVCTLEPASIFTARPAKILLRDGVLGGVLDVDTLSIAGMIKSALRALVHCCTRCKLE